MFDTDLAAVAELADADPMVCDRGQLTALVRRSNRVRAWLDAFDARIALRADQLSAHGQSESAATSARGIAGRIGDRDAGRSVRAGVPRPHPDPVAG